MVGDWVGCLWWVTGWGVCDGRLGGVFVVGDWVGFCGG